jgi:hypothetical protein
VTIKEMLLPPLNSGTDRDLTVEELLVGIVNALVDDRSEVQVTSKARASGWIFLLQQVTWGRSSEETDARQRRLGDCYRQWGVAAKTRYGLDIVTMR